MRTALPALAPDADLDAATTALSARLAAGMRARREALGLSLGQAAERAHIAPEAYQRLEAGLAPDATIATLCSVASALRCEPHDLFAALV